MVVPKCLNHICHLFCNQNRFPTIDKSKFFWVYLNTTLSVIGTLCYLYTATCNAGVLVSNEDNSIENGDVLEKKGWSYCQICQLYRPVGATHCGDCGVCFERYVCDM